MSLKFEKGFGALFEAVAPHLPEHIPLDINDIPGARAKRNPELKAGLESVYPECPDVKTTWYETKAKDGYTIRILGLQKKEKENPTELTSALIHYHGGGMVVGECDMFATALANMVSRISVPIFTIDYRLAPENKGSVLVEDCYAGILWLHEHAEELGIDKARIGVFGESAGGGLSAGVSLIARDRNLQPPLAKQILIYPMLDDRTVVENPAIEHLTFWNTKDNIVAWQAVLEGTDLDEQTKGYVAPARAKDVSGLPSAFIDVGSLDIFREENAAYAMRLLAANVECEFHIYAGLPHGFEILGMGPPSTNRAIENRLAAMTSF